MRKAWMGLLCGLLAGVAQSAPAETPAIEASMQVTGTLSVDASGAETGYVLDQPGKLPPPVVELLAKTYRCSASSRCCMTAGRARCRRR